MRVSASRDLLACTDLLMRLGGLRLSSLMIGVRCGTISGRTRECFLERERSSFFEGSGNVFLFEFILGRFEYSPL